MTNAMIASRAQKLDSPPVLHPAAQEAAVAYSDALSKAAAMEVELRSLQVSFEAAKRHIDLVERQLADSEAARKTLERFVVQVRTSFKHIVQTITTANEEAVRFANGPAVEKLEEEVAQMAVQNVRGESP